jgi:glycosyltransferase involved in cell wall biosynthesis
MTSSATTVAAEAPPETPAAKPLGQILIDAEALAPDVLERALTWQKASRARIGEVLTANALARPEQVATALASQIQTAFVDLAATPPHEGMLDRRDLDAYLRWGAAPWRMVGGTRVFAATDPDRAEAAMAAIAPHGGRRRFVIVERQAFERMLRKRFASEFTARASNRTPRRLSARWVARGAPRAVFTLICAGALGFLLAEPDLAIPALFSAALVMNLVNIAMKLAAIATPRLRHQCTEVAGSLPTITVIIALYREGRMAAALIEALDYPRERLDVILVCEEDDPETATALLARNPPPWIRVLVAPDGAPRTKPRALNHALEFARGEIVGVYDAEDRPASDQLRKVAALFRAAPPKAACAQARLGFYNHGDGWLARCFAIEYATWFHMILPSLKWLRFPIPLGGTSVFFRARALRRIGAWDAHNVTEDADLGMRLARAGYETALVDSETAEEANCRVAPWVRQRSRWQKGYLQTWAAHMRAPLRLWRNLGTRGFIGFQAIFIGAASGFLSQPLFWGVWAHWTFYGPAWPPEWLDGPLAKALIGSLLLGQVVLVIAAVMGARRAGKGRLALWALTMPFYWPLGALSAIKSLVETALAPMYWDKTAHGVSKSGRRVAEDAAARGA